MKTLQKPRRVNFYAGPGTGKSTIAAGLFSWLKQLGANVELVTEYAKDATWEKRGSKVFQAQEYLFGKQHFRLFRMHGEVDFIITDSPILMSDVYTPENYALPSLRNVFVEAHDAAENLDIFLIRNKPYNPKGRNQDEQEARILDSKIRELLKLRSKNHLVLEYGREKIDDVGAKLIEMEWIPDFTNAQLEELIKYHNDMLLRYAALHLMQPEKYADINKPSLNLGNMRSKLEEEKRNE